MVGERKVVLPFVMHVICEVTFLTGLVFRNIIVEFNWIESNNSVQGGEPKVLTV